MIAGAPDSSKIFFLSRPDKERQHWPIAQRDGPPIPFGRDDATKAFFGADRGIDSQVRITPRKEVLALPL
jgi:hypothetical protein